MGSSKLYHWALYCVPTVSSHTSYILVFVMAQGTGREMEEPEAKGSVTAWRDSPARGLPWSASMMALGLLCQQNGCCDDAAGREAAHPLACQESSQGLEYKSRHWSHPDPLNKSCTVYTPPIPLPHPSGQGRVRQGHPWRLETGHPGSEGARERGCESQGQGYTVRPAGRE